MTIKNSKARTKEYWPVVVYISTIGLGFLGYVIARIVLDGYPHPLHWVSGLGGAVVGFFVGWLWFRYKGDII